MAAPSSTINHSSASIPHHYFSPSLPNILQKIALGALGVGLLTASIAIHLNASVIIIGSAGGLVGAGVTFLLAHKVFVYTKNYLSFKNEQKKKQHDEVIRVVAEYYTKNYEANLTESDLDNIEPIFLDVKHFCEGVGITLDHSKLTSLGITLDELLRLRTDTKVQVQKKKFEEDVERLRNKRLTFNVFFRKYEHRRHVFSSGEHADLFFELALKELVKDNLGLSLLHNYQVSFPKKTREFLELQEAWKTISKSYLRHSSKTSFTELTDKINSEILDKLLALSPRFRKKVEEEKNKCLIATLGQEALQDKGKEPIDSIHSSGQPKPRFLEFFAQAGLFGLPKDLEVILSPLIPQCAVIEDLKKKLHISVKKGMMLYGPPGTGKTKFARKLAEYLSCPPERLILMTGTDILDKYVGQTEKNIRELFRPAKEAYFRLGEQSPLFIIVIDEIDSLLAKREIANQSWERNRVNQFLGEMDGLNQFHNIFVIGLLTI